MKKTLAIETSCDDTSLAIVRYEDGVFSVDAIKAYSQIWDHQQYGGVVPEIAFRLHSEQILALLQEYLPQIETADSLSVTTHPWLVGSLLVGKTVANMLSLHYKKPLVPVNHIYGHIFSLLLERNVVELPFPWIVLTASGGHNEIYFVEPKWDLQEFTDTIANRVVVSKEQWVMPFLLEDLQITKLGKTLDDAAGECFDKVARMLWGPYPWGARIGQQALKWQYNPAYTFKKIFLQDHDNPYDFSFSWMKSQVYTLLQKLEREWVELTEAVIADIAYMFQEAVVDVLAQKLTHAAKQYGAKTVGISWWVSANDRLFEVASMWLQESLGVVPVRPAKKLYSTDNGAMVGVIGLLS